PIWEAARQIGAYAGDTRRVTALARGTHIETRALALPPDGPVCLGSTRHRNDIDRTVAPGIALEATQAAIGEADISTVGCLVTTSCTGYTAPSWAVGLTEACGLPRQVTRLPITEAGCAGGVVALARAVDHLAARADTGGSTGSALVTSVELCSLAFHPGGDDGNLTSTLIFGDGAGAALLQRGEGPGLTVLDSMTMLVPDSQ